MYASLKGVKANVTIEINSENAEIYRISKSDLFYYYGPNTYKSGDFIKDSNFRIIESLKSICDSQQINLNIKIKQIDRKSVE